MHSLAARQNVASPAPARFLPPAGPAPDAGPRRMPLWLRLRCFANRPAFRERPLRAAWEVVETELRAAWDDLREAARPAPRILESHPGAQTLRQAGSVAVFIHYAPRAEVSAMVLEQVRQLAAAGFAVVFLSMAPGLPAEALERLRPVTALALRRRNRGLDFGGWHDVVPLLRAEAPAMRELLLANDSLCGPIRPLAPLFRGLRAEGPGFFGLTESLAPRPHLQSYFLLARGRPAVRDALDFLGAYRVTASKRLTIRRGEIRFSAWMRERGHRVRAWCGYEAVERAALRSPRARLRLRAVYPFLFDGIPEGGPGEIAGMAAALSRRPTNPTHLFWRELVESFGFPFVKTDLLLRNPLGVADPMRWAELLPAGEEAGRDTIEAHLAALSAPGAGR